jgi:hypothetical protein
MNGRRGAGNFLISNSSRALFHEIIATTITMTTTISLLYIWLCALGSKESSVMQQNQITYAQLDSEQQWSKERCY